MSLRKLGRYGIVRVLGRGAMGIVYEGRDPNLDRRVAIKTVRVENLSEEAAAEYEARFRTEARSAARLQHPNIVSVYDSDRDDDVAFLVMEYIQGDDLKQHLDKGERYSLEQALRMIRDLLSALDYAHQQGIVHRDIKPANLLIEPGGRVKLTDFGVARIEDSNEATRTQGAMVGTLKYMSPEQVQGQKIDARSDLFSVGVVLYQLLTDRRPFEGESEFTIIQQIAGHIPPPPSSFNARLPPAIDEVMARALAKHRDQRFATAREFAAALQSAMRLAEDATVVPPADPQRALARQSAGASALATSPGTSPLGGSTVPLELELVYWKDVKDSSDAEDIQLFLAKFPSGIYAELARRRLRKLTAGPAADQTLLTGVDSLQQADAVGNSTVVPAAAASTQVEPANGSPATEATVPLSDPSSTFSPTVVEPRPEELVEDRTDPGSITAARASAEPKEQTTVPMPGAAAQPAERPVTAPSAPGSPGRRRTALLAGIGALVVAAAALVLVFGRGTATTTVASSPASAASAPVVAASTPIVAPPVAVEPPPAPAVAAAAPAARPPPASAAVRPSPGAGKRTVVKAAPVASAPEPEPARPVPERPPAASEPRPEVRSAAVVAPQPPASNPADSCRERIFLARELCLAEQCQKPAARNHALCIQWRADAKLREEGRIQR